MHVGIFAERFLGRYGADRVLVIMAEQLRAAGHQVTLFGVKFGRPVVDRFAGHTFRVPEFAAADSEGRTLAWFRDREYYLRRKLPPLDLCVVGSYPFIGAIPHLAKTTGGALFVDFGVVPSFGLDPGVAARVDKLRAARKAALPHCKGVLAISEYLAREQSRPDAGPGVPVHTVLLGADHLATGLGTTEDAPRPAAGGPKSHTLQVLDALAADGRKVVLCLGRFEPGCYKNSQAAFDVIRAVMDLDPKAALLVLADQNHFRPPPGLEWHVFAAGLPSDADLEAVNRAVDVGVSMSLWEGFNLPLAELQFRGKAVFAFDLAAHPEVAVSRDQLCADADDMATKVYRAIRGGGPPVWERPGPGGRSAGAAWREKFSWGRFGDDFLRLVECAA